MATSNHASVMQLYRQEWNSVPCMHIIVALDSTHNHVIILRICHWHMKLMGATCIANEVCKNNYIMHVRKPTLASAQ